MSSESNNPSTTGRELMFADQHNLLALLQKPNGSNDFHQIIDFLKESSIAYALTVNPTIYINHIRSFWNTATLREINGVKEIHALVDEKPLIINEAVIRRHLQFNDESGISSIPNHTLVEQFKLMGYEGPLHLMTFYKAFVSPQWKFLIHTVQQCLSQKRTAWNEFSSTLASAIVCLATGQVFNFSLMIFNGMLWNLENKSKMFLMYPRFLQVFINNEINDLNVSNEIYLSVSHTKKVFANMRRQGKGFSGKVTPLFSTMVSVTNTTGEGSMEPIEPQPTPATQNIPPLQTPNDEPILQVTPLPHMYVRRKTKRTPPSLEPLIPQPLSPQYEQSSFENIDRDNIEQSPQLMEVITKEKRDHVTRAHPTASTHSVEQDRVNIIKTQLTATSIGDASLEVSSGEGPWCQETMGGDDVHARHGTSPVTPSNDPHLVGTPQGDGEDRIKINELMETCTKLSSLVEAQGKEIAKLKRVVHKMRKHQKHKRFQMSKKALKLQRLKKVGTSQVIQSSSPSSSSSLKDASQKGEKDGALIDVVESKEKDVVKDAVVEDAVVENVIVMEEIVEDMVVEEIVKDSVVEEIVKDSVVEEIVESLNEKEMQDVENVIAKVMEDVMADVGQLNVIKSSKPKEKGFEIPAKKVVEKEIDESVPTNTDKRPKGIISTKQGPKVVILEEIAGIKEKGKGRFVEKEKPAKSSASQVASDAELARQLVEEEKMENERNEMKKLKEEEQRLRMKKEQLRRKAADDRMKFSSFLKTVGYEGRQLGPMKLINLAELYEQEKKMLEEKQLRAKLENERLVKESLARGAQVVRTDDSSRDVQVKRKKQMAKKNPNPLKKQKVTEHQSQSHEEKDVSQFIVPSKAIHVDPIQMIVPVKDWEYVDNKFDHAYFVRRADFSWKKFGSFHGMISHLNREDIEKIYEIGLKKIEKKKLDDVGMIMAMEWMDGMFKPKAKSSRVFKAVRKWEHFEKSGIYCITRMDSSFEYYLVERKYDHGLLTMRMMMEKKLNANSNSREAMNLVWKIIAQIKEEEELQVMKKKGHK